MRAFKSPRSILITLGVCLIAILFICLSTLPSMVWGAMTGLQAHEKYIYPIVRVSTSDGTGSGSIIFSDPGIGDVYSTYILTNYHVIANAVSISEEWDSDLGKNIKKEKRAIVYVEIFKYRDISTPIGTMRVEADIVIYNKDEDVALLKLRTEDESKYVAHLLRNPPKVQVMDESVAVGCSLGFPPLPSVGVITRLNFQIDSLPYHMSCSQIIYGNSGGAIFLAETGELIGIPSRVVAIGWSAVIPHMGLFIPINRVYTWLAEQHYDFIYDSSKVEAQCLDEREKEIEAKKDK